VQEQLGLPSEAIRGARELLAVPLDPKLNDATRFSPHWQGVAALIRTLVKYERWNEILQPGSIPWGTSLRDRLAQAHAEALAKLATNHVDGPKAVADFEALKKDIDKPENASYKTQFEVQSLELRATLALKRGDAIEGLTLLAQAAPKELELRASYDDPPFYPTLMYAKLGDAYLQQSSPKLAVDAFEKALEAVRNDPFALAGLVQARHALGDTKGAAEALGQLLYIWQDAEPGLRWLENAKRTGIKTTAQDRSAGPQRNYRRTSLDKYGPAIWQPFAAPELDVRDHTGARVSLDQFRGKNVVLVFYLGVGCAHCVQQLKDLNDRKDRWKTLDAEVLAVSADPPTSNAASQGSFSVRLLSDDQFANARRFKSYDDFEGMPIHSTILIDKTGRVHWARHGSGPFTDYDFLIKQLQRMNEVKASAATAASAER
jgi:peroxiredoxin